MKILVINTGSSSIKYQLYDMQSKTVLASGVAEKLGEPKGMLTHKKFAGAQEPEVTKLEEPMSDHKVGLTRILELMTAPGTGVIQNTTEIDAVGHRVVHGGESFQKPMLIDEEVINAIKTNIPLAPLHNPANLTGIETAQALFAGVPQIAVFDTAFHQTLEPQAYLYALPYELYEKHRLRRYGFHGTSHYYVTKATAEFLGKPVDEVNIITAHLGNGASITAVENGLSVDTSMGLTPLEGLIMGTRCGDIDPAIPFFLADQENMDLQQIDKLLNKESGLKGLCGDNDMRDIIQRIQYGDTRATLALDMVCYRIKKYIGSYWAVLGRLDAIVFTAGIGENNADIRKKSCEGLELMGVEIDEEANNAKSKVARDISTSNSKVKVLVVPTNEELEIAEETLEVMHSLKK